MTTRRSGTTLVILGLLGIGFFWLTDPRYGVVSLSGDGNLVDRANRAFIPTAVGIVGSAMIFLIGLWLARRKAA